MHPQSIFAYIAQSGASTLRVLALNSSSCRLVDIGCMTTLGNWEELREALQLVAFCPSGFDTMLLSTCALVHSEVLREAVSIPTVLTGLIKLSPDLLVNAPMQFFDSKTW